MSGLLSMLSGPSKDIQLTEVDARSGRDDNGDLTPAELFKVVVKMQSILRGIRARKDLPPGFGKWPVESSPHEQARSENNPHYRGKRIPVGDDKVPWSVTWEEYNPEAFTSQTVLDNGRDQPEGMKWADPPDPKLSYAPHLERRLTFENDGVIVFDPDGYPLNPRGRTGLRGRGLLGAWGPNHAADPIVTRREPLTGTIQVRRSGTPQKQLYAPPHTPPSRLPPAQNPRPKKTRAHPFSRHPTPPTTVGIAGHWWR